jgi:hypothetical protein
MQKSHSFSWPRISAEGAAIVISILLAFMIDASWQGRQETLEGKRLAGALASEIIEHRKLLDLEIVDANELIEKARTVLDVIAGIEPIESSERGLAEIGNIFVMKRWHLTDNIYRQSVSSGKLLLIEDEELRFALADYHSLLADLVALLGSIETQYYLEMEPFMTKHTIYTEVAHSLFLTDLPAPPFTTDYDALARNKELWNLMALRLEIDIAYLSNLERAREGGSNLSNALLVYANQ